MPHILLLCLVRVELMVLIMMKKNNQQNVVSFSVSGVIRELTSPRVGNPRVVQ